MYRSKILGGLALASLMLVVLTGCPSVIANIVGASESVQQAVDSASAGDTIKIMGSHDEDVTIDKDNITLQGETGCTIDGQLTINGDGNTVANCNVNLDSTVNGTGNTLSSVTIKGRLTTEPGSFRDLTLNNVTVGGWNNANVNGTFSCTRIVQPGGVIQDAIGKSQNGDAVCVAPDTYTENLTLNVAGLTLRSLAGASKTIIDAGGATEAMLVEGGLGDVTIKGFKFTENWRYNAIFHSSRSKGSGTAVHVLNNIVRAPEHPDAFGATVQVAGNGSTVIGNEVEVGSFPSSNKWDATGILVTVVNRGQNVANVTVRDNHVHGNNGSDIGISTSGWNADAIMGTTIANNTVNDVKTGIGIFRNSVDTVVEGNMVENNQVGVLVSHSDGDNPSGTQIHTNNIMGNASFGAQVTSGPSTSIPSGYRLNATDNWWGDASGPSGEGPGSGDAVSQNVNFSDWASSPF